jgi:hypothetical protein
MFNQFRLNFKWANTFTSCHNHIINTALEPIIAMTAGERVGPFEVESKLVEHEAVAEAGVIGKPDPFHHELDLAYQLHPLQLLLHVQPI